MICRVEGCEIWVRPATNTETNRKYSRNTDLALERAATSMSQFKGPTSTCGTNKGPEVSTRTACLLYTDVRLRAAGVQEALPQASQTT